MLRFTAKKYGDYWYVVDGLLGKRPVSEPLTSKARAQKYAHIMRVEANKGKGGR